jgi:hypothetical protein
MRTALALLPFATGVLALACGGSPEPSASSSSPRPTLGGHHVYTLDVVARSAKITCPIRVADAIFHFGLDLDVNDIAAQGWLSLAGVELAKGTPPAFDPESESMAGTLENGRAVFDPFQLRMGQPLLLFPDFSLSAAEDGKIQGTASGNWETSDPDLGCLTSFTATITGVPDETPPDATLVAPDPALHLPYQSIAVTADEPIFLAKTSVKVSAGGVPVPSNLVFGAGKRPGFANTLSVAPVTSFPAGESISISLSLADAAGNSRDVSLGPITIAPKVESGKDLGFEGGLDGWYADPPWNPNPVQYSIVDTRPSYPTYASDGSPLDVMPVEGSLLAYVKLGGRLMGYLVPPAGAKRLRLSAAVVHGPAMELSQRGTGLLIQVFAEGAPVVKQDGTPLLPVADPSASWTGWGTIKVDLPAQASTGFWLQVEPFLSRGLGDGVLTETTVLLDDLAFE